MKSLCRIAESIDESLTQKKEWKGTCSLVDPGDSKEATERYKTPILAETIFIHSYSFKEKWEANVDTKKALKTLIRKEKLNARISFCEDIMIVLMKHLDCGKFSLKKYDPNYTLREMTGH